MLNANQIEEHFQNYVLSNARKGALLISGPWGSGKTHLALKNLSLKATTMGLQPIYLTISDVENQDGFERNLFLASCHLIGEGKKRLVGAGFDVISNWLSKYNISVKDLISARDVLSKDVLIFVDDLERATPDLQRRILYRLANLIETKGTKVVILADETQIKTDDGVYSVIKEKAIGRTIEFQPTYEELAQTAVKIVYDAPPGKNTAEWKLAKQLNATELGKVLTQVLTKGACRNLRTAIAATVDSCELAEISSLRLERHSKSTVISLVHSTMVFVVELKKDKRNSAALRKYVVSKVELPWMHFLGGNDPLKDYLMLFERQYVDGMEVQFLRSNPLLDFVEKGAFEADLLLEDIAALTPTETAAPAYKRLLKYQSVSKEDFSKISNEALTELSTVKLRSLHAIAESAQTLFFFSKKKLISSTAIDLRLAYYEAIDALAKEYMNEETDISLAYDSSLLWNQPQDDLKLVLEYIQKTAGKLENIRFSRFKVGELSKLRSDPGAFLTSLVAADSPIATSSCLINDDARLLYSILQEVINEEAVPHYTFYKLERALSYRYSDRGFGKDFQGENEFLLELSRQLTYLSLDKDNKLLVDSFENLKQSVEALLKEIKGIQR